MTEDIINTDVLVVGGGGAAFRAAIGAREKGAKALLVSKGPLARCGATPMAGADLTLDGLSLSKLGFAGEPKDSPEIFFNDIVHQGFYLNNQKLLEQYVSSAPERLRELVDWGMKVRSSEERAIYTTGIEIMDALHRRARETDVQMLEDVMILDLLIRESSVVGALGLDIRTGQLIRFHSKAVIIATGGWHKAFWPNTGTRCLSGDGIAMANRAGAEIGNMEFITFCCNVLFSPPMARGSIATYIMSMTGGELYNTQGETFLDKYDPSMVEKGTYMEWNKGFVSYLSAREVRDGKGSPRGGIYYGLGRTPWEPFEKTALAMFPNWKYKALDLSEVGDSLKNGGKVEVGPAAEYFDGGIVVNELFETSVAGLYAAGECTLGPFGANRVCAAITEMLVHGVDAGRNAADYAGKVGLSPPDRKAYEAFEEKAVRPLSRQNGENPSILRRRMQEMAHSHLSPIRRPDELDALIVFLENMRKKECPALGTISKNRTYNKEWVDVLELENMVHLLEASARSALLRTESRGVHCREDHPYTDNDNWLCETRVRLEGDRLEVGTVPPTFTSLTPPGGVTPYLDMWQKMIEAHSEVGGHH